MRKVVIVAGVVGVLGAGIAGYGLLRTGDQLGQLGARLPRHEPPAPVIEPPAAAPRAAPSAMPQPAPVPPRAEPAAVTLTADERSPFGHATDAQLQPDHEATIAEAAAGEASGDAKSLAPLLSDAHETLAQLIADAEGDADAKAELAALLGSGTPFEALLEDPDPAVREEAAKLLAVLGRTAAQ